MIWYVGNGLEACGLIAGLCLGIFIKHRQGYLLHPQHLEYIPQDLDEDEMSAFLRGSDFSCPFYQPGDEYRVVRKQM